MQQHDWIAISGAYVMQNNVTGIVIMMSEIHVFDQSLESRRDCGDWRVVDASPDIDLLFIVFPGKLCYLTNWGMNQRGSARMASGKMITKTNTNSIGTSNSSVL